MEYVENEFTDALIEAICEEKPSKTRLFEFCQEKLGRYGDYDNFNVRLDNGEVVVWDAYDRVRVPIEEFDEDQLLPLEEEGFIDFEGYAEEEPYLP